MLRLDVALPEPVHHDVRRSLARAMVPAGNVHGALLQQALDSGYTRLMQPRQQRAVRCARGGRLLGLRRGPLTVRTVRTLRLGIRAGAACCCRRTRRPWPSLKKACAKSC